MRRFTGLVLFATLLFVGIGGLVDQVGARFRSDEKALAILQRARLAIGGETEINNVRSMTIIGKTTKQFAFDGIERTEQGDVEINFELPGKMSKSLRFGSPEGGDKIVERNVNVIVAGKGDGQKVQWTSEDGNAVKRVVIKKKDGTEEVVTEDVKPMILRTGDVEKSTVTTEDGKTLVIVKADKPVDGVNENGRKVVVSENKVGPMGEHPLELFKTTLALLLTAPQGLDVSYAYAGEGNVDGATCDVIDATVGEGKLKLFIDRATSLPRMLSFQGHKPMVMVFRKSSDGAPNKEDMKIFERRTAEPEMTEIQIKYSDYRTVGGLQLPFKWTQTIAGAADESTDITSYEVNPANIGEKFKNGPATVVVKMKNKDQQ